MGWWVAARELTCCGPRRCAQKLAGMGTVGRIWGCLTWAVALQLETVGMGRVSAPQCRWKVSGGGAHFSPGCSCQHWDTGQKVGLPSAPLEGWQWQNVGG